MQIYKIKLKNAVRIKKKVRKVKMKKLLIFILALVMIFCLAGCGEDSSSNAENSVSQEDADQQPSEASYVSGLEGVQLYGANENSAHPKYVQTNTTAEEGYEPALILNFEDNSFIFKASSYDGMVEMKGIFSAENDTYTLAVKETTALGGEMANIKELKFVKNGEDLSYSGEQVGITPDGAVFAYAGDEGN